MSSALFYGFHFQFLTVNQVYVHYSVTEVELLYGRCLRDHMIDSVRAERYHISGRTECCICGTCRNNEDTLHDLHELSMQCNRVK